MTINITDSYLMKIMSEYSQISNRVDEKISNYNNSVKIYNETSDEYNKFVKGVYDQKFSEY